VHRAVGLFVLGCARNTQDQGSNTKAPPPARCFVTPNLLRAKSSAGRLLRCNAEGDGERAFVTVQRRRADFAK
jgi:hypothetical protein